jgi:hypothetical protein
MIQAYRILREPLPALQKPARHPRRRLMMTIAAELTLATHSACAQTITPPYAQLSPGQSIAFSAGTNAVTWQVNNGSGTGITQDGVYTAPATPPNPAVVTITAVSTANWANSSTATVTLLAAPLTGTTRYVATNGRDTNPGTEAEPFATLQHAASVARPGDTVLASAGTYNKLLTLSASGTAAAPITFASRPGETAIIDGTGLAIPGGQNGLITLNSVSNVIIEGFRLQNYTTASVSDVPIGIYVTGAGSGVQIVNNRITAITTTAKTNAAACANGTAAASNALGVAVYGSTAPAAIAGFVFSGNEVDHLLTGCSETVSINGNVTNFAVLSNAIHDDNNIGIDSEGFEQVAPKPAYDQARNGLVRGNLVYNITSYGNPDYGNTYSADGIYVDGGTKIIIEQNIVHNADLGIEMASETPGHDTSTITARNNLVYACNANGISIGGYAGNVGGSDHITIVNNTLYGNDTRNTGSGEFQIQFHATSNVFRNNIAFAGPQGLIVNDFTASEPQPALLNNNLYYAAGGAANATFLWQGKTYTGLSAYRKASAQEAATKFANPLFAGTAESDFDLQSDSPAFGAGIDLDTSVLGTVDIAGNPRIGAGNKVTQGAYQ